MIITIDTTKGETSEATTAVLSADVPEQEEAIVRKASSATRKFTFNIDEEVYQQLCREAFEEERDMTSMINEVLGEYLC